MIIEIFFQIHSKWFLFPYDVQEVLEKNKIKEMRKSNIEFYFDYLSLIYHNQLVVFSFVLRIVFVLVRAYFLQVLFHDRH
jgi:hypothetical protein